MVSAMLSATGRSTRAACGGGAATDPMVDRRYGLAVVAAVIVLAISGAAGLPMALALAGVLVGVPGLRRRRLARVERNAIERELAGLLALLRLACGSGLGTRAGLAAVAPWVPGLLGSELAAVTRRVERGRPLVAELDSLAVRWGGVLGPLCRALLSAERYGAPLLPMLERLDTEATAAARRRQDEAIRRLPVRLLMPLGCTILPAFVLLAVVPLVAASVTSLAGS